MNKVTFNYNILLRAFLIVTINTVSIMRKKVGDKVYFDEYCNVIKYEI